MAICGVTMAPIAIGYSNGAIIAAALLLIRPWLLTGAIPFRLLSPFSHAPPGRLDGVRVLIFDGEKDSRRSPDDGASLAARLRDSGAMVAHHVLRVGWSMTNTQPNHAIQTVSQNRANRRSTVPFRYARRMFQNRVIPFIPSTSERRWTVG
jgi:predicted esterase